MDWKNRFICTLLLWCLQTFIPLCPHCVASVYVSFLNILSSYEKITTINVNVDFVLEDLIYIIFICTLWSIKTTGNKLCQEHYQQCLSGIVMVALLAYGSFPDKIILLYSCRPPIIYVCVNILNYMYMSYNMRQATCLKDEVLKFQ